MCVSVCVQAKRQQQVKPSSGTAAAQPLALADFSEDDGFGNGGRALLRF